MTSSQAKEVVEEQVQVFEDYKDYLIQVWDEKGEAEALRGIFKTR